MINNLAEIPGKRSRVELGCSHRTVSTSMAIKYHNTPSFASSSQKHMPYICIITPPC
uniref:Alpha/beta hydrolase domain containing protein 1,3, putative n=1 Tax=Arundo donax TaxID=35708 RepID=A0A0A9GTU5_ARUDO